MKAISGYAPIKFIRIVKMKKATALLREPDSTITKTSNDIGDNGPDYFSKGFKNYFAPSLRIPKEIQITFNFET